MTEPARHDRRTLKTGPVLLHQVPKLGLRFILNANSEEKQAVIHAFNLVDLHVLSAEIIIKPEGSELFQVSGHVSAKVVQECVVTLEPVEESVDQAFELSFVAGSQEEADALEEKSYIDPEDLSPDIAVDGRLSLEDIVLEQFALGLNPYPRKEDAVFTPYIEDDGSNDEKKSPFAKLEALKKQS
jgi:uncharacterized metal-binding protein YceD (DUF177 family)